MNQLAVKVERLLREHSAGNTGHFGPVEARALLRDAFPAWIQDLGFIVEGCSPVGARLRLPYSPRILRNGETVSGQALMASADTAMAIAIMGAAGKFTNATTINQNIDFLRPIVDADVIVLASVRKAGRSLIFTQASFVACNSGELSAHATATWARMP